MDPVDDRELVEALLAEERVGLVPLSLFFADRPVQAITGACSARLTLARPEAMIREAAERLRRFLDAHRSGQPAPPQRSIPQSPEHRPGRREQLIDLLVRDEYLLPELTANSETMSPSKSWIVAGRR